MQTPMQLTFRDIDPSPAIADYVRKKASKLDNQHARITSCRVAVEAPHRSHVHGKHYRVRVDVNVPGREIVAGTSQSDEDRHADLYAAIDDAFDEAERVLRDHAQRARDIKTRSR
jgi:ribosomal subunit interface protein